MAPFLLIVIVLGILVIGMVLKSGQPASPPPYAVHRLHHALPLEMTTTGLALDGYRTVRNLGVVRGITVRSRSVFGTIGGSLQTLFGGNISLFTQLCEQARDEAFQLMLEHARQMGANAVVALRYDANEVMQGVSEVLCYGTAVVVEPLTAGEAAPRVIDFKADSR